MKSMKNANQDKLIRELDWNLLRTFMFVVQEGSIIAALDASKLLPRLQA